MPSAASAVSAAFVRPLIEQVPPAEVPGGPRHTIPMCYVLSFLGGAQGRGMDVPGLLARHGIYRPR